MLRLGKPALDVNGPGRLLAVCTDGAPQIQHRRDMLTWDARHADIVWGEQEAQAEKAKAVREAQAEAQDQLAEVHKHLSTIRDQHEVALRDVERQGEARLAEAARKLQYVRDEHQRAVRASNASQVARERGPPIAALVGWDVASMHLAQLLCYCHLLA